MEFMEIINAIINYGSVAVLVMFLLVSATQIIVEVLKVFVPKLPTSCLTVIVAVVVTVLALIIALQVMKISIMWYYAVGALVFGFFVAYAAMFGFDKFTEILTRLKEYREA